MSNAVLTQLVGNAKVDRAGGEQLRLVETDLFYIHVYISNE